MTRLFLLFAALSLPLLWLPGEGSAAPPSPDWPCIQGRQPHLSLGQVWTGPQPDAASDALADDPAIAALAERVAQRRMPLPEAESAIAEFAAGADDTQLIALMQAIFQRIDDRRSALVEGIGRYGHKQVALAAQIDSRRQKMAELEGAEKPDFDAIDAEERALDIETRIFTDRQQSLTWVCETPVILEQRLFSLARAVGSHLAQ